MVTGNPISTWNEISKFGESFPSLESLIISECPIKSLDPFEVDNTISSRCVDSDRKCETEGIAQSNHSYKRTESECEANQMKVSTHHFFRRLKLLNLNYTLIESWDDVDRLGKFPELQCLRIQGCPLFEVRSSFFTIY